MTASHASAVPTHSVRLLVGAVDLFPALVEAIDAAQHEVWLETYIFSTVGAGADVAEALMAAAQRGVVVRVVVDGVGTGQWPADWSQRLAQSGVQWRVFSPLNRLGLTVPSRWRRLHRKLCVVDAQVAFCGGINILDDFLDPHVHGLMASPRLDYAVQMRGPLVNDVQDTMTQLWSRMEAVRDLRHQDLAGALEALRLANPLRQASVRGRAQLVLRDNVRHRSEIERTYRKAIGTAHHEVVVASAYFFPGLRLRRALVMAAKRGVRVRLLLQGQYEYLLPYRASRQLYGQLMSAGVEIYEYHASYLHAKVAVIDSRWATVGSSNLDPLSLLLAREANVVVRDPAFARDLQANLEAAMHAGARRVEPHDYLHRPWLQRGLDVFAAWVLRFGVFLTGKRY
ncbi:cardiolipin synthase ClsB [Limnohabitans sp. B9-3]|uniref:cardiolipin synthase ClsB n=1 Tax=Limnohabitans sp. B9-3 TaxID=1100707 RepID=UPI001E4B2B29|nr:cardiolipin synthase ClsB [Limnohabitans sp. B9-3]